MGWFGLRLEMSGHWGWHFLASNRPVPMRTAAELLARMPPRVVSDMMEWGPCRTPDQQLNLMLSRELDIGDLIALSPRPVPLSDDRPINEYYLLRSIGYH